jgi:hypothetical protein
MQAIVSSLLEFHGSLISFAIELVLRKNNRNPMDCGLSLTRAPTRRTTVAFLILSCLGMLFVFRGAIWGDRILAPLDIAATLYPKYKWIDPTLGDIPRNHHVIDMVDHELARAFVAHGALASGEFPWWDPHSHGGGPLAAEPHGGITDPLRLLTFKLLPFVTAYNWTRILQSFLGGLGMFLLLRFLGFAQFTTVLGALSFQFAATQASFYWPNPSPSLLAYYPFLWLVLAKYARTRPHFAIGLGGLLCAAIIMAGTQQSHAYLVLFLVCFVVGYGSCFRRDIISVVMVAGGVFALGSAIAAPVLIPQIELFQLSSRKMLFASSPIHFLTGIFSLTGVFPWFSGSFRTLDLSKLFGPQILAYVVYIGTPAMILAVVGILAVRKSPWAGNPAARTGLLLVLLYFVVICSTPLMKILYYRSALLAVLGLIVMFAAGWEVLIKNAWPNAGRLIRWMVLLLSAGILLVHAFALFVYPQIKGRILEVVLEKDAHNPALPSAPPLRRFQVDNLPNEVTFKNPEPLLAFAGALCLLGFVGMRPRYEHALAGGVFMLNLLPLLIFSSRGMPSSPVEYWNALLVGGPEQNAVIKATGRDLRLQERVSDRRLDTVFPGTTAAFYGVHSLQGYVSLILPGSTQTGDDRRDYNVLYESKPRQPDGQITVVTTNQVRFVWSNMQERKVRIIKETANSIRLHIEPGPPGELVRTDTYYPGWRVEMPKAISQRRNRDGFLALSIPTESIDVVLRYVPSQHHLTMPLCLVSLVVMGVLLCSGGLRRRSTEMDRHVRSFDEEPTGRRSG